MIRYVDAPHSLVRAAVARGDVTPSVGIYHRMWGAAVHDRSTGIHRPLTATVLYLAPREAEHTAAPQIVIALDHCLLWAAEMQTLLEQVSTQADVDRDALTVFFSHTHAAGLMGLERQALPGGDLIPSYLDHVATEIARLVTQARAELQPATVVYGSGRCDLATNRDYLDDELGTYVCGFNPGGLADDTVIVARIESEAGTTLGTLVNYACHPTTLAWDNTLISPDYLGAMREVVEAATSAPCFFVQGASGDIGPREGFVGDTAVADRNGRQLGYAVLAALAGVPPAQQRFTYAGPIVSGATIGTWRYTAAPPERLQQAAVWRERICEVELSFRTDLPQREQLEQDRAHWTSAEQTAREAGDEPRAREARAMIERATRRLTRVEHLPQAETFTYRASVWRMGDAVWLPLDGEHYNVLQRELRSRFPGQTLVIGTLANGSHVWYLPDADSYGRGLYQEEASVLARGSLERLIEALSQTIEQLLD